MQWKQSLIFSGDKGLAVHPPAFQMVNLKTSLTLEKTQAELWLTFPETEYDVSIKTKSTRNGNWRKTVLQCSSGWIYLK